MIHDSQTDLVFIPQALRNHFPGLFTSLTNAFLQANVKCKEIPHTYSKKHLWARDYMPITVDMRGDIAQFEYNPDYLRAPRYADYKPDMPYIWHEMGMTPFRYNIILDGGNVLTDKNRNVYMTDKVFLENPDIPRKTLTALLRQHLNARSINFIHWDKSDMYGHVDGMMAITDEGKRITDLSWEYLNFLRVGNNIFMAQLGKPTDEPALKRIQEAFPDCTIFPIKHVQTLTRLGGGLHCATWNTVEKCYQNEKVFKTSKRHPFNPFDEGAFTEKRLRAVIEHDMKKPFTNYEWTALDCAFETYWHQLWHNEKKFSFPDFLDNIYNQLKYVSYMNNYERLKKICNHLYNYMLHVPRLIIPENSTWDISYFSYNWPKEFSVHFRDCTAVLNSFKMYYEPKYITQNLIYTKTIKNEAKIADKQKNGKVYILKFSDGSRERLLVPYRYEFNVTYQGNFHLTIIWYWLYPDKISILNLITHCCRNIRFFEHCITDKSDNTLAKNDY